MRVKIFRVGFILAALAAPLHAAVPRLAVVLVVDQMRADYLDRFSKEYRGGFARLKKEGAVFTHARQGHVPTETSPGHATLLTGCFPAQHGILGNEWWDRGLGRSVYPVEDPDFWRSPAKLLCPSLGDVLKAASPGSKVVSLSGKDRAAILMGGRHPDMVLWYDRSMGRFLTGGYYGHMPKWVWLWDDKLRIPPAQRVPLITTPRFDEILLDLAERAIEEEGLGQGGPPDLLTVSLSATDYIGHAKGPDSPELKAQLLALDLELGRFLDYLDRRLGKGSYVVALSADHGVMPMPESPEGKRMGAWRLLKQDLEAWLESGLEKKFGVPPAGKKWLFGIYTVHVYLNLPLARESGKDPAALRDEAERLLTTHPAVAHVFRPEDLRSGAASPAPFIRVFRRSFHEGNSGDLLVLFKEGVLFTDSPVEAGHLEPYDYDARIPLVLMGAGIRPGRYDREALSNDLAPTLARVLNVQFSPVDGARVLGEALRNVSGSAHPAGRAPSVLRPATAAH